MLRTAGTSACATCPHDALSLTLSKIPKHTIELTSGTGAPQTRIVASNTVDTITPTVAFSPAPAANTVYQVLPLNRPERACVMYAEPIHVSCSQLLDPSQTVPTDYGQEFCVTRDGQLYYAQTTLPKANGWKDCSAGEVEIVAQAPDCADLK